MNLKKLRMVLVEDLQWGKGRGKWCNYIRISNIKEKIKHQSCQEAENGLSDKTHLAAKEFQERC